MVQYNNKILTRTVEKPVPYNVVYTKANSKPTTKITTGPVSANCKSFVYSTSGWTYTEDFVQPELTSNGEYPYEEFCAFQSSNFQGENEAWNATHKEGTGRWQSDNNLSLPQYMGYFSNRPIKVESITMNNIASPDGSYGYNPRNFKFQGSNDNINWDDLLVVTNNPNYNNTSEDGYTLDVNSPTGYYFHRIYVESVNNSRPAMVSYLRLNGKIGNK